MFWEIFPTSYEILEKFQENFEENEKIDIRNWRRNNFTKILETLFLSLRKFGDVWENAEKVFF